MCSHSPEPREKGLAREEQPGGHCRVWVSVVGGLLAQISTQLTTQSENQSDGTDLPSRSHGAPCLASYSQKKSRLQSKCM